MALTLWLEAHARIRTGWTYDALNDKAMLVVIAIPIKVRATSEIAELNSVKTYHDGTREIATGAGVETSFEVLTVLKGERNTKDFVLHHFVLTNSLPTLLNPLPLPTHVGLTSGVGPLLVSFEPNSKKRYLMFLQKEADGRYAAVSGQTDPWDSSKDLGGPQNP